MNVEQSSDPDLVLSGAKTLNLQMKVWLTSDCTTLYLSLRKLAFIQQETDIAKNKTRKFPNLIVTEMSQPCLVYRDDVPKASYTFENVNICTSQQ